MTLIPQLGKKYRLSNALYYSKGKLNCVVTVHTLEQEENGSYRGFLSCGGNTTNHDYQDEGNWCLFFNNMQNCIEEIEEEYPMRREMTIKKKKDGTYTVRMSREELLFIATVCGWVGGDPQGSRRHASKFCTLVDDYFDEEEKCAEVEKFEDDTRGIYVKDGK